MSTEQHLIPKSVRDEKGDKNRWIVLALASLYSCSNAIQWVTYAPVASSAKAFFHFTTAELNMMSTVYMIVFVVGSVFTCTSFERWGLRRCVLIGSALNALGAILKFAIGLEFPSYLTTIIPQVINSFSQLFVLSTPPLVAAQYFPPTSRAFATAIAATANTVGYAMWLVVPPIIVTKPDKTQFQILFGIQLALCVGVFLGIVFFFKPPSYVVPSKEILERTTQQEDKEEVEDQEGHSAKEPFRGMVEGSTAGTTESGSKKLSSVPTAPDASSVDAPPKEHSGCWAYIRNSPDVDALINVLRTCKELMRNRDFVLLLISFSVGTGSIWSFFGVLAQISAPVGVTELQAGISGAVSVAVATIFAYLISLWVDRTHRYKIPVVICFAGSVIGWLAVVVVLLKAPPNTNLMDGLCISMFIFSGLFQNTATPICFEFALELTYPLPESVPGALLMTGANLISLILMFICSAMMGDDEISVHVAVYCVLLYVGVCAIGSVIAIFPREKLGRLEAEQRQAEAELEEEASTRREAETAPLSPEGLSWVDEDSAGRPSALTRSFS